ncbi:MAG: phosphatidate cytidylyltransferase [Acidimicrobiia bacterium]
MSDRGDQAGEADPGSQRRFVRPWERDADAIDEPVDTEAAGKEHEADRVASPAQDPGAAEEVAAREEAGAAEEADTPEEVVTPDEVARRGDDLGFGRDEQDAEDGAAGDWLSDLEQVAVGSGNLEEFRGEDYAASTTREYQDLAAEVTRAGGEEVERQAVAASLPGVGQGLIGFDDVTGRPGVTEEEIEHLEQARASDLTIRVVSALVIFGLFAVSVALGGVWLVSFITVVLIVSLGEYYATLRAQGFRPVALFGLLAGLGAVIGAYVAGPAAVGGVMIACLVATMLFYSLVHRRDPLVNATLTVAGVAWVGLLAFAGPIVAAERGRALVLLVVVLVASFDVGGYFVGRAFGRRPLAPVISPNKTVEGLIGGVVVTFAVAAIASTLPLFEPVTFGGALLVAGVASVFGPLGDAVESIVKRSLGVKDMGSLLPGHGGMLDRIDAILFSVPAVYVLFEVLGYL